MIVEVMKEYRFEAAHRLPRVPAGHKCANIHGHSYKVELWMTGPVDPATGWLLDAGAIDERWAPLFARLDHRYLNDVPGLENATCENVAVFVWNHLKGGLDILSAVTVWETHDSRCTYRGE